MGENNDNGSTASIAADLFQQPIDARYRCTANGPPVSFYDYLLCRCEQSISSDGNTRINPGDRNRAAQRTNALKAILDQILGDMRSDMDVSPGDIDARYGAQLSAFQIGGTSVGPMVSGFLKYCYARAGGG
jgi:hypothetical protein